MKTDSELITEFHADLKRNGKMQEALENLIQKARASVWNEVTNTNTSHKASFEAGRQSALAEISKLKQAEKVYIEEGVKNRTEIDKLKQEMLELAENHDFIVGQLNEAINEQNMSIQQLHDNFKEKDKELSQFREGVGKLKQIINEQKTRCFKERGLCSKDSDGFKHWDELLAHYVSISNLIDEIFPSSVEDVRGNSAEFPKSSCAEQPHKGTECDGCCVPDPEGLREALKQDATIPFNSESSDQTEQPVCVHCGETKDKHKMFEGFLRCVVWVDAASWHFSKKRTVFEPKK